MKKRWMMATLIFCFIVLGIDVFSKIYTYNNIALLSWSSPLYPYGGVAVFKDFFGIDFSLNYATNKGAAWGVFSDFGEYLLYARLLIMGCLLTYLLKAKISHFRRFSLFCVLTGAVGNVLDFFCYGHVIDMFNFRFWGYSFPIFNVADSVIFCGVAFLFSQSFLEKWFPTLSEVG